MVAAELLASLYYLSSLEPGSTTIEEENQALEKVIWYAPEAFRPWFEHYRDYYATYDGMYPSFSSILERIGEPNRDFPLSFQDAFLLYRRQCATWESDHTLRQMLELPLVDRRLKLQKLNQVLSPDTISGDALGEVATFDLNGSIIRGLDKGEVYFQFPLKSLNDSTVVRPGVVISVIGLPSSGKTTWSLNTIYLNSVINGRNSLYIYLENTEDAYNIEILARHSFALKGVEGIYNSSLKRGVIEDDVQGVEAVRALQDDLKKSAKGHIFFAPFSKFNPDPLRFVTQLAEYVTRYNIDIVCFDYAQKAEAYTPIRWDRREYLNRLVSDFASCALGQFGCKSFVGIMLAQPKKDVGELLLRKHGQGATLYAAADVTEIERSSFIVLHVYSDSETKAHNTMLVQILKNRDGDSHNIPVDCPAFFQHAFCGDMLGSSVSAGAGYSLEDLDSVLAV